LKRKLRSSFFVAWHSRIQEESSEGTEMDYRFCRLLFLIVIIPNGHSSRIGIGS